MSSEDQGHPYGFFWILLVLVLISILMTAGGHGTPDPTQYQDPCANPAYC